MKKQDIVNLIKYHVDKDEVSFRNIATSIAREFYENGDEQIAKYIVGLLSGPISFSPQDISDNYGYFTLVEKNASVLLLPTALKQDLEGVINACKSKLGINKIIFEGKPGTGKTESALIIAKALKRELLMVNSQKIIDSRLGQSAKNLSDVFEFINLVSKKGNYVFLLDEIDSLVMDRINNKDLREMGRVTSTFLIELEKLNPNAILIATTNLFKELDRALTRRFDVCVSFDRYTKEDCGILAIHFLKELSTTDNFEKSDYRLIQKLFEYSHLDLSPSEIRNLIKLSLAFTGNNKESFIKRISYGLGYNFDDSLTSDPRASNFTTRDLEMLTNKSKSSISRKLRSLKNGL